VAFELEEALSVDCPDEYFGAEVLAQVVREGVRRVLAFSGTFLERRRIS